MPELWEKYRRESNKKLPLFRNPEEPAEVLSNMLFYSSSKNKLLQNRNKYNKLFRLKQLKNNFKQGFVSQKEIEKLCKEYELPLIKNKLVNPKQLDKIKQSFFPLVLKGINSQVIHKSELCAVKLNIKNKSDLRRAAKEIKQSFVSAGFKIEKFLIQQFVKPKHELLVGGFRDPSFGPAVMFGSGGKYVEALNDTVIKSCYLSDQDIEEMINSTVIGLAAIFFP